MTPWGFVAGSFAVAGAAALYCRKRLRKIPLAATAPPAPSSARPACAAGGAPEPVVPDAPGEAPSTTTIDWGDERVASRLKALVEDFGASDEEARGAIAATDNESEDAALMWISDARQRREATSDLARGVVMALVAATPAAGTPQSAEPSRLASDLAEARAALESGAHDGRAEAAYENARLAYRAAMDGEVPDLQAGLATAFTLYREAARRGHPEATRAVGSALFYGAGVQQDRRSAREWFQLAAERGCPSRELDDDAAESSRRGPDGAATASAPIKWDVLLVGVIGGLAALMGHVFLGLWVVVLLSDFPTLVVVLAFMVVMVAPIAAFAAWSRHRRSPRGRACARGT